MTNQYIGWTLTELRAKRREVQELLDKGRISRQAENGSVTEFSEKEQIDLERRLQAIYYAIAQLDGATDEEIAASPDRAKIMRVVTVHC